MAKEGAMQLQMDKEKVTGGIRLRRIPTAVLLSRNNERIQL